MVQNSGASETEIEIVRNIIPFPGAAFAILRELTSQAHLD
jgi:hypothetical protein